jgi:CcmD family protein
MKHFRWVILFLLFFTSMESFSQANEKVDMADILRRDGKIYTIVFGLVLILSAMIILLIRLDRRIFRIERQVRKNGNSDL